MKGSGFIILVTLLLSFASARFAGAQATKYGQAGMTFLAIDADPRVAAMGGTWAGPRGSAAASFANPAGLALLQGGEVIGVRTDWIADISHNAVAAAYRVGNYGTFGVNAIFMDYGPMRRTIPYQGSDLELRNQGYIDLGNFEVSEWAVGVSYARQITEQFYVGGNFRMAMQDLGEVEVIDQFTGSTQMTSNDLSNVIFDFGTLYYTGFRDLRFGASFRNFSNQSDYFDQRFELPLTFDFGVAMDVLSLTATEPGESRSMLTLAADWVHPRDNEERMHLGLEYGFMEMLFLRGGYKFNYDEQGLTGGLGVRVTTGADLGIRADYAYGAFGDFFGEVHRVAFGVLLP